MTGSLQGRSVLDFFAKFITIKGGDMSYEQAKIVFHQSGNAMLDFLEKYTIGIVIFDEDENPQEIGSGTCVTIAGRYFIATAAHVISKAKKEKIRIIYSKQLNDGKFCVLGHGFRGGNPGDTLDVGWIEIGTNEAQRIEKEFVKLDQVCEGFSHAGDNHVCISGYPAELVDKKSLAEKELATARVAYLSVTIEQGKFNLDPTTHICIDYPEGGNVISDGSDIKIPAPHGFSGGGVWVTNINIPGVWSPSKSQLVGIQVSWNKSEQWVKAIQIQHWIAMLEEDIPNLKIAI